MARRRRETWESRNPEFVRVLRACNWGDLFVAARESVPVPQYFLADDAFVYPSTLSRLESTANIPTIRSLAKFATLCGATLTVTMAPPDPSKTRSVVFDGETLREAIRRRGIAERLARRAEKDAAEAAKLLDEAIDTATDHRRGPPTPHAGDEDTPPTPPAPPSPPSPPPPHPLDL